MTKPLLSFAFLALLTNIMLEGCAQTPRNKEDDALKKDKQANLPANMYIVQPVTTSNARGAKKAYSPSQHKNNMEDLTIGMGHFFSYALPPGWKKGEDGQFALTLVAPDNKAYTVMVGNAGLMPGYAPDRFVYEKLMALQPSGLTLSNATPSKPVTGFQEAYQFSVSYQLPSGSYRGEAVCHISNYYGGCVMAMTAALSESTQWSSYASWLPPVSRLIAATNGAAFGMRGIMQQNLQNSIAFGEAMQAYRTWSANKWQEVTDDRNRSVDNQNYQFRENLGAINTWSNPYNTNSPIELSTKYQYYWMNQQGTIVGSNDASANPNHGSTFEWQPLKRKTNP
jgi:hypothetical protein